MKKTVFAVMLGVLIGGLAAPVVAQGVQSVVGAFLSHESEERIDISVGATRGGDYVRESRLVSLRSAVVVPDHYGELVSVTSHGESAVLWYRDGEGEVRNVIVPDGMIRAYRFEQNGSKLVADIRKPF